jgi:iron complex outermembrane recepter protein
MSLLSRWLLLVAAVSILSAQAVAQETLDEVVVSARKRAENAQDVPISLSRISGAELQRRGLVRVQDIVRTMPNVSTDILSPRQASLSIRGLGRNPANDALESSVGVFLDGVYLGRPGMMVADLIDLERVEVLRGPQGALFGKNATAGVLNIITARPGTEPEGWIEMTAGDHDLRELRGATAGPFGTSPFAYRVSGFVTEREGFIRDTTRDEWLGELKRAGARAQLAWQPAASLALRLIADYGSHDENGPGYLLVDPNMYRLDDSPRANNLVTRGARFGYTPRFAPGERRNDANAEQRVATENAGVALLADWDFGRNRLSSITGWRKFSFLPANDGDYSALDVLPQLGTDVRSWQFSQELRIASPTEGTFQYLAGLQFFEQHVRSDLFAVYGSDASEYLSPGLASSVLDGFRVVTLTDPDTHSYSVFGQSYWWPRSNLEIAAGVRWTAEEKATTVEQRTEGGSALAPGDVAASQARQRLGAARAFAVRSAEDFVSGSLSVTWHFNDDINVYLSAARGAKSGGVNAAILPLGADLTVDPEIALGFEAGIKTLWLDDRLQFNASAFHTTIDGYQASIRDRVVGASYLANAGEVRSVGAESEVIYRPWSKVTLTAGVGYNDARYESFRNAACPPELDNQDSCDFTGERVAGAPPLTLNGSFEYDVPLRNHRYRLRSLIDYSHADGYRAELSRSTWIGARDLVNVRASIGTASDSRSMTLWVSNVFDEVYFNGMALVGPGGTGVAIGLLGAPRTFGLSLQLRH